MGDMSETLDEERLLRIGRAAVEVDRLRERQAAAKRARNKIACQREGNRRGYGDRVPCWKNSDVINGVENECDNCQRRYIRQQAFAAESVRLAGARRRVTMLARRYRRRHAVERAA